ncbi:hypothetical protein PC2016_3785 [Pseudoalteromonas carrageenovora]|uniref:Uncharacterized protein n=1 Tax=Pseudoalteromonas carrageenovora IAM 12662 TaxID=1314868 RepID=A0A2K4XE42_PSEVC|nr:hypothetical protein [Pseudoalteromonas carrageenovora]MBE0384191.1 hypothetical protein [Pseudoalteromonas carrageenovora IAM 12662]QBJ73953.1 hypothetical protein PC2016_3785 [Pseudoalteromonas carrageenovora]GEB73156.1 hypothetical protein PCA01_38660 [Pseudoalteromonas carrageenovora]SOU42586.1 protein of unknown function [Pseudoalteromonas carrageenovora IAM 12662]
MKKEKPKKLSSPQWADFTKYQTFERQCSKYSDYLNSYVNWFAKKSNVCRFAMKQGLFLAMFAGSLFCINKFEGSYDGIELWLLVSLPCLILTISLLPDFVTDRGVIKSKSNWCFITIYFVPALLKELELNWEACVIPLLGIGLGMTFIFYLINRLEGYTRAWSRYRTAQYKVSLISCQKQTGLLTEKQALYRLHHVINSEVESRHKEIISDLHFFGDKVNGLIGKQASL